MCCTSRTILVSLLVVSFFSVLGCGSDSTPPPEGKAAGEPAPNPPPEPPEPNPGNGGSTNPQKHKTPDVASLVHEMDPAKHAIPGEAVHGRVDGTEFHPTEAIVESGIVTFLDARDAMHPRQVLLVFVEEHLPNAETKKLVITPSTPAGPSVPSVMLVSPTTPDKPPAAFPEGYALTFELGPRKAGKRIGKIYLCLPDAKQSVLAGTFIARSPRPVHESPTPEERPFVQGKVNVRNAKEGTQVLVGYAANPAAEQYCLGASQITLAPLENGKARSVREVTNSDPSITTVVVAGDGKEVPGRYDHTHLPPGRYLVYAILAPGGPATWKWVTVEPNGEHTVDLNLDASQTGGLDIGFSPDITGKVRIAPADDGKQQPIDDVLFAGIALQFQLQRDIIAQKARYDGLAPGRYEVRAGDEKAVVEVTAGKTAELNLGTTSADPKKK